MATYATRDFLAQYKNVDKAIDPVIEQQSGIGPIVS